MSDWTREDIKKAVAAVGKKAATDKAFRAQALANPGQAIEKVTGKPVPKGVTISLIENKPSVDQTYILPDFVGDALSQKELDSVAGGCGKQCQGDLL